MARIVLSSAAFLGDVAPFVEPANRLVALGHDVTFLTPVGFHAALAGESFDLAAYPLDFSPAGMRADPENERLMRHPWLNQVRLARYWMRRGFVADPAAAWASFLEILDGADVLVTHPTFGSGRVPAAHHLGIPVVVGQLFPMMMPTTAWTPPLPDRNRDLRVRLNRLAWRGLAAGSGTVMYDRSINRYRRRLGLPGIRGNALLSWTEAERTVVMVSRHYFGDPPLDWTNWPLTGFSAWPGPAGQLVDHAIDDYLSEGEPPVLVCLGTSAAAGAGQAFATMAEGLRSQGLRPLVLAGNADNLAHLEHEPGAFEFAPVHRVVDRCAVAIVSGALGTLAAVLTAGLPVVVVPQLFDQIWHGRRVEALGVGVMATNPTKAPAAVAKVLRDPAYRHRAHELADKLRAEDGAAALVNAVRDTILVCA